ncbi:efflux RND transporter periplasmic adaptor subunit [Flavihumibacter sp. UBA7668]|uniref:efflux RND transporter periplasmic adaptor subunit n=1 Tax=Flavihumibacter sp. UBA7668 TaxID=1946542 RepID=UPI0025C21C35|nr:efflux RND transporter periplasmic adaptor subunit [Flavihumibacter sp. UBA7668]
MRNRLYTAIIGSIVLAACGQQAQQAGPMVPSAVKVTLEAVQEGSPVYYEEFPATLTALDQVELRPQVSGFVTGIHFKDGQKVRKGQLLYSIDAQLYNANYQQAVANLNVQEANLSRAQKDADRYHELQKNDAVARQLVDNADAALEVAQKQVEAAKAAIAAAQTSVRYTRVIAPFDGVIGISLVKPGAPVTAGQTLMNTVSSVGDVAVDFNLDQSQIYHFTSLLNKPAKDSIFVLSFGEDHYPVPGRLVLLDRAVDAQTGTIKARVVFPNKEERLRTGMNGTLRVKNQTNGSSLLIPYKAVTEQLGEFFVYRKTDSSTVSQQKVVLGTQIGTNIIVKTGLQVGDSIVTQGVQNLREGAKIESVPAPTSAPVKQ